MCRCETITLLASVYLASAFTLAAQTSAPAWKRVAGYTIQEDLAGPATGPVRNVWYASNGNRLLVATVSNRVFETADFQHWRLNTTDSSPIVPAIAAAPRLPIGR